MLSSIFFLSLFFPLSDCSGYLEIRLKSAFNLPNATVTFLEDIYFPHNKRVYDVPLVADETRVLTNIPVTFHRPGTVLINSGPVDKFGLHYETVRSDRWNTKTMTISEEFVHLPFTGIRIDVLCNRNWHGSQCDRFCNNDHAEIINRRCTWNGTLGCPEDLHGPHCDQPIDQDSPECQCQNDGYCVSSFSEPFDTKDHLACECPIGWEGAKCEKAEYQYAVELDYEMHGVKGSKWGALNDFFRRSKVDNLFWHGL